MTSAQNLAKIKSILQTEFSFSKVILFGSQARGTAKADSDIDLCILNSGTSRKLDVSRQVRRALHSEIKSPIDVLVYSPEEFASRARELKSIERVIAEEGIPLYG